VELVTLRAQVTKKTEVVTAVQEMAKNVKNSHFSFARILS
jgi:hypothetical protein